MEQSCCMIHEIPPCPKHDAVMSSSIEPGIVMPGKNLFHVEQISRDRQVLWVFFWLGTSDQDKPALGLWNLACRPPDPARRG
jgi:hypothetical protein